MWSEETSGLTCDFVAPYAAANMRRPFLAVVVSVVLIARFIFPTRVQLDWPTVTLIAVFISLFYTREFAGMIPLIKRLKLGEAEIELQASVQRLHKDVESAEEASHPSVAALGSEEGILELASRDKESAVVRLAIEIEKELAAKSAINGLAAERSSTIRAMVDRLTSMKVLSPATASAIIEFRNVRNQVIHPAQGHIVSDSVLASAIDSGIRILRILRAPA
jgi:hypothetical protein